MLIESIVVLIVVLPIWLIIQIGRHISRQNEPPPGFWAVPRNEWPKRKR